MKKMAKQQVLSLYPAPDIKKMIMEAVDVSLAIMYMYNKGRILRGSCVVDIKFG